MLCQFVSSYLKLYPFCYYHPAFLQNGRGKSFKATNFEPPKMERELLGLVSQKITLHGWGTLWGLSRVSEIFVPIRFSGLWFGYHRRLWTGPCYRCSDLDGVSWDQRVWQGHRNGMKWMTGNASNESTSISWIPFPKPLLLHPQILRFTLPQTNSSHLKHWSWFRWVSFWGPASWQVRTVLGSLIFRVHSSHRGFVWSWVRLSAETMRPDDLCRPNFPGKSNDPGFDNWIFYSQCRCNEIIFHPFQVEVFGTLCLKDW